MTYLYEEVLDKIENARRFGNLPGVEVSRAMLHGLGEPQKGMPYVHIAGTNGKGSVCAFLLARKYGMMFVQNMTGSKFYNKYQHFLEKENQFEKMFALLIFLPVAPDDFLCYLAGVSRMRLTRFTTIILLGKPAAILMYSMGLHQVLRMAMAHLAV